MKAESCYLLWLLRLDKARLRFMGLAELIVGCLFCWWLSLVADLCLSLRAAVP